MSPILTGVIASGISGNLVSPSSFESIATANISTETNIITFSSIPSTYRHLQLRAVTRSSLNNTSIGQSQYKIQFNGDTGANYSWHTLLGNGSTVSGNQTGTSQNQIPGDQPWGNPNSLGSGRSLSPTIIDILDYQNTNKNKTIRIMMGFDVNSTSTNQAFTFRSGAWYNTSAITSITLDATAGAFSDAPFGANTQWALYGIKGS
jgi:hypothetical protein